MSGVSKERTMKLIRESLAEFFEKEKTLIKMDVSERALCSRLAMCFEKKMIEHSISGYYADVEFNRKQGSKIKTIINQCNEVVKVTCDLIVHSRGENGSNDNLIAIEMGKSSNKTRNSIKRDHDRLKALTMPLETKGKKNVWIVEGDSSHPEHVCGYRKGIFIKINKLDKKQCIKVDVDHFASGRHCKDLTKTESIYYGPLP